MWPIILIGSLLPVWRRAGVNQPLNAWQYVATSIREPMKHLSVEEAIERARQTGYLKGRSYTGFDDELPTHL